MASSVPGNPLPLFSGEGDVSIQDELVTYLVDGEPVALQKLRDFRAGMARAQRKLAAYDARRAEIIPIRKRGKKDTAPHAASS